MTQLIKRSAVLIPLTFGKLLYPQFLFRQLHLFFICRDCQGNVYHSILRGAAQMKQK